MKMKRIFAFLLTACMLMSLFAGCSDDPEQQDSQTQDPESLAGQMVYQASYKPLDLEHDLNWVSAYCISGDTMYFGGNCNVGEEPLVDEVTGEPYLDEITGEPIMTGVYEMVLFALDVNTHTVSVMENYQPVEIPEDLLGSTYMMYMTPGADGTIWTLDEVYTYYYDLPEDFDFEDENAEYYEYYMPGENKYILSNLDQTGQVINSIELSAEDGFYPSSLQADSAGNLYLGAYDRTIVMDSQGNKLFELSEDVYGDLVSLDTDKIGILGYDDETGNRVFHPIDVAAQSLGESFTMPANVSRIYAGIGDYAFLFDNYNDTVYGYNSETGESEKLFSWMDCDISQDYINQFTVLDDGTVLALSRDYSQTDPELELVEMKLVDASTVPQKTQLTLACMWMDSTIRAEVINFNKSSSDIRINVVDYSQYNTNEDPSGGLTRLNTEIMSGKVPDLIMTDDLPVERYAAKGLLLDLWTMIDSDSELSREDLMTHFFEAVSVDGKLYEIYSSFAIQTALANGDYVGDRDGWTLQEMQQVLETLEPGAQIFSESYIKSDVLSTCLNRSLDQYIDWGAMTCTFDSQEFIDVLNFANSFPLEFNWEEYDWETAESDYIRMTTGKQLMTQYYVGSFDEMQYAVANVGPNPVYVGFPSSNGTGSNFTCYNGMAISASCSDVDAAWSFVRMFLTEEHQRQEYYWQFPTNRVCFEEYAAQKMEQEYETDPATGEFILDENGEKIPISQGGWGLEDGTVFEIYAMTQEQYDQFMRLYENTSGTTSYNQEISDLINSEVEMFFHGEKSAEDTAAAIQSKISLFLMEQI